MNHWKQEERFKVVKGHGHQNHHDILCIVPLPLPINRWRDDAILTIWPTIRVRTEFLGSSISRPAFFFFSAFDRIIPQDGHVEYEFI
jgi:hypothetical protein